MTIDVPGGLRRENADNIWASTDLTYQFVSGFTVDDDLSTGYSRTISRLIESIRVFKSVSN
ncbi:hypothetical protein CES85_4986 [Ochrobactrum quorumnocens]|uniref:Uncharacterized protein n=1 Tax=Ochrobactrum quorumnocens TaxID=271865 RepID=A0A248UBY1_9HYPH|nr:hypothetical protein CES85_4986 [[Ochrobactrum] quorumnocens]